MGSREPAHYFERAIAINRELGHLYSEALDDDHLGDTLHAAGKTASAHDAWHLIAKASSPVFRCQLRR
jgi:hypothetical protein